MRLQECNQCIDQKLAPLQCTNLALDVEFRTSRNGPAFEYGIRREISVCYPPTVRADCKMDAVSAELERLIDLGWRSGKWTDHHHWTVRALAFLNEAMGESTASRVRKFEDRSDVLGIGLISTDGNA